MFRYRTHRGCYRPPGCRRRASDLGRLPQLISAAPTLSLGVVSKVGEEPSRDYERASK